MSTNCVPFVLSCHDCDAGDGIDSWKEAILQGWIDLVEDDGLSWTWLGVCPECLTQLEQRDMRDTKLMQIQHDRYEELSDEAHAIAREQEIDDEDSLEQQ